LKGITLWYIRYEKGYYLLKPLTKVLLYGILDTKGGIT